MNEKAVDNMVKSLNPSNNSNGRRSVKNDPLEGIQGQNNGNERRYEGDEIIKFKKSEKDDEEKKDPEVDESFMKATKRMMELRSKLKNGKNEDIKLDEIFIGNSF